jgi:hypothetical protein
MAELLSPKTTLGIILGASEWPYWEGLAHGQPFANSGKHFCDYLLDEKGFGLPTENLLNLFDTEEAVSAVERKIATFLKNARRLKPQDLLLYYVGHGGFLGARDYYLALRSSVEDQGTSVLRMQDLASTIRTGAPDLRRYLILDCCFAARAFQEFQSAPGTAARQQTLQAFPSTGTALLCSSSAQNPSIAPKGGQYTMFTGALLKVLRDGSPKYPPGLSLNVIGEMVEGLVKEHYEGQAVRPQVLSPHQDEGNIAKLPLFPNIALKISGVDQRFAAQDERLSRIEDSIKGLASRTTTVIDTTTPQLAVAPLEPHKYWGLSKTEWFSIPVDVRADITSWRSARLNGICWAMVACLAFVGCLYDIFLANSVSVGPLPLTVWGRLSLTVAGIIGLVSCFAYFAHLFAIRMTPPPASSILGGSSESIWRNLDIVGELNRSRVYRLVGSLFVASPWFEISLLLSLTALGAMLVLGRLSTF